MWSYYNDLFAYFMMIYQFARDPSNLWDMEAITSKNEIINHYSHLLHFKGLNTLHFFRLCALTR